MTSVDKVSFCDATADDRRFVWKTNNDPDVRQQAINTESIPWTDHVEWYDEVLDDPERLLWIVQHEDERIGVIRFDLDPERSLAEITVALLPSFRGRGLGRRSIEGASRRVTGRDDIDKVVAHVRPDNEASRRAFEAASFEHVGRDTRAGIELDRLEYAGEG